VGDDYDPKKSFLDAVFSINKMLLSPIRAMGKTSFNLGYLVGQIYALMKLKPPEIVDKGIT
tara:strand:- start:17 stop:199 length:183 start_codon:yes stop_codon:yes gene_type:complete